MRLCGSVREAQLEPQLEQLWVQFSDISTSPKFLFYRTIITLIIEMSTSIRSLPHCTHSV